MWGIEFACLHVFSFVAWKSAMDFVIAAADFVCRGSKDLSELPAIFVGVFHGKISLKHHACYDWNGTN